MKLRIKRLGLETGGKPIVILNRADTEELGIRSLARVRLEYRGRELTAIVNISSRMVKVGEIGISEEVRGLLQAREGDVMEVEVARFPTSLQYIRNKLAGRKLSYEEIYEIVKDVVEGNLSEIEIATFVSALETRGIDLDEATALARAMVETGETLDLKDRYVVDKHSIGGVVGDKTSMLLVPIIASLGLTIPKTSSRAITSAGGTADKAECLMPVTLDIEEMKRVVRATGGCIVWGGTLRLAPADDIFIQVEYPLAIDPLLFPSIMSKKKAVGAKFLVIDIPCGRGTKVKTIGDANLLAKDFIELGKRLGIKTQCAITYGEQPIGHAIGPALEAREALEILMGNLMPDAVDKATDLAAMLLGMVGKKHGKQLALNALKSGKAEKKLRQIIAAQGGNPKIKPEDIEIGTHTLDVSSKQEGFVQWINNAGLVNIARAAGAPKDKGAGIRIYKKVGESVKAGEKLLTIYAEKARKLERAEKVLEEELVIGVGKRTEMLIQQVKEVPVHKRIFILER